MCQEKVESNVLNALQEMEKWFYDDGYCPNMFGCIWDNTPETLAIYQGNGMGTDRKFKKMFISDSLRKIEAQTKRAQHFLDMLRGILEKSRVDIDYSASIDNDSLSLELVYKESGTIFGYVQNMDYIFDRDFIYEQLLKSDADNITALGKMVYFRELFHNGIIKSCKDSENKLFCKMLVGGRYKRFICVPSTLVNFELVDGFLAGIGYPRERLFGNQ